MIQSSPVAETASHLGTVFGKVEEIHIEPDRFSDGDPTIPASDGPIPVRPISPVPSPLPPPYSFASIPPASPPSSHLPPTFAAPLSPPLYASASPRDEERADGQRKDEEWEEAEHNVGLWKQDEGCDLDETGDEDYDEDEQEDYLSDGGDEEGEVYDAGECAQYQIRIDIAEMIQRQSEIERRNHALQYFQMQLMLLEHQQRNK